MNRLIDKPAPVALFVYNRPEHTRLALRALERNSLAEKTHLYVFCDGPKSNATDIELDAIDEVKQVVKSSRIFKTISVCEQPVNCGLEQSIVNGINTVLESKDRIIVLEDDLVTAPGFLVFMNNALSLYENQEKVMHISGYMYPIASNKVPKSFFVILATCWGWATWRRAWRHYKRSSEELLSQILEPDELRKFDMGFPHKELLDASAAGTVSSWAIKWHASVFLQRGLCLHPAQSYVQNIGHDGSGRHCGKTNHFRVILNNDVEVLDFTEPRPNLEAERQILAFCNTVFSPPSIIKRFKSLAKKALLVRARTPLISDWYEYNDLLAWWGKDSVWKEISDYLGESRGKVLDIGCGSGEVIIGLSSNQNLDVYGCDISNKLITKAIKRGIAASKLMVVNAVKLSHYGDRSFDYSVSIAMAQYLSDEDLSSFLDEVQRITRQKFFLFVPVSFGWRNEQWSGSSWHLYRNNAPIWWKKLLWRYFDQVEMFESKYMSDFPLSVGKWFVCKNGKW